ncbi:DnaJ-domain-containing protein [Ganoderma leucocontextum]|nr:DnaJ-domain-containing protein [Ganoderma leucocontextum]
MHLKAQGLWKAAEYELAKDNYDRALTSLAEAVALEPHEPEYYITRAFIHMKLHEYATALRDFDLASTKPTYTPRSDCLLPIARCRLLLGSPSSALLAVKDALSINGADGDALSLRRRILELEGHIAAYRGAVSRDHWRMARSAYESCLSVYAQEHSDAPGQVNCWGVELLIAEGKLEDAMKSVDVLLRDVPNDVDAMTLRGLALFLEAKPSEALTQLAAVLKLDPDNGTAKALRSRVKEVVRLKGSGNEAFQRNEYQTAIASWASALGVLGERDNEGRGGILRSILLLDRATALCKVRKFADGLKDVNESLQLCPADYKAFLCRARIMVGLELFETAAEDFRATLEHGEASLNSADKRGIEAELEEAERRAKVEGSKQQDHYVILGLTRSCSAIDIKKAYRALSLKHHPDKGGVAEKFRQIARGYEVLSDPDQKRAYDAKLQNQSPGPSTQPAQHSWWQDYFRKGPDLRTV